MNSKTRIKETKSNNHSLNLNKHSPQSMARVFSTCRWAVCVFFALALGACGSAVSVRDAFVFEKNSLRDEIIAETKSIIPEANFISIYLQNDGTAGVVARSVDDEGVEIVMVVFRIRAKYLDTISVQHVASASVSQYPTLLADWDSLVNNHFFPSRSEPNNVTHIDLKSNRMAFGYAWLGQFALGDRGDLFFDFDNLYSEYTDKELRQSLIPNYKQITVECAIRSFDLIAKRQSAWEPAELED